MKKILFCVFLLSILSCNDETRKLDEEKLALVKRWKLTAEEAKIMKAYLKDCNNECKYTLNVVNHNNPVYENLIGIYGEENLEWTAMRYTEKDQQRYCASRGFPENSEACNTNGYITLVVRAMIINENTASYDYYDIVTICPPPKA